MTSLDFGAVPELTALEQRRLQELADVYQHHQSRNAVKTNTMRAM